MTTAVSIALYLVAALMAASTGVTAQQFKRDKAVKATGKFSVAAFLVAFLMAAALQVSA